MKVAFRLIDLQAIIIKKELKIQLLYSIPAAVSIGIINGLLKIAAGRLEKNNLSQRQKCEFNFTSIKRQLCLYHQFFRVKQGIK